MGTEKTKSTKILRDRLGRYSAMIVIALIATLVCWYMSGVYKFEQIRFKDLWFVGALLGLSSAIILCLVLLMRNQHQ